MKAVTIAAVLLIAAGVLGLAYGGFTYTQKTHKANLGPIELRLSNNNSPASPISF